jgi:hypothetical protein
VAGVPAAVVITEQFVTLCRTAAAYRGLPDLATLVVPHPFDTRPDAEVAEIAAARFAELVALLTAPR